MTHIRIRYAVLGGHVHCGVWSTEGGPETTHGHNGRLIFRPAEFDLFRETLMLGDGPLGCVEFINDADRPPSERLDWATLNEKSGGDPAHSGS